MRKLLVGAAVLAIASSAMAAELVAIPRITNLLDGTEQIGVYPRGITPDGRFVGGTAGLGFSSAGKDTGFVYDAATGTAAHLIAGGYQESVDGIGYWTDGTNKKVVVEGSNGGWQSMNYWDTANTWAGTTVGDSSTYWTKNRQPTTAGVYEYYGSGQNRVAGNSDANGRLYGVWQRSNTELRIDAFNGTGFDAYDFKSTTNETTMNGISNDGTMVGVRGGRLFKVGPYVGGSTPANGYVNGAPDGSDTGTFYDIADNGSIMGGHGTVAGKSGLYPFVFDGVTSTELPSLGGTSVGSNNGVVYSISPNGDYAVGTDYSNGYELAVLWDLRDMNNIVVTDLTAFAAQHGILGEFTGNLRRGTAIGIDEQGNPVIAGVGYAGTLEASGWTGFVMTIPEPATLTFLAIGGLALLRRRR